MGEFFNNLSNNFKESAAQTMNNSIGGILINLGTNTQKIAMIVIALGALLLICRNTKVLRYGVVSYFLGILIELIGITLIK